MKRGQTLLLSVMLGIFFINLVSAAYYGSYSLSNLLNEIDASTIFLGAVFIIAFAFINFSLSKVFKDNKATSGIVAFAVSLLITYGINRSSFDFENLFYNFGYTMGLSSDIIYMIGFIVFIALIVYLAWKLKKESLVVIGGLLIALSFFTYEKLILIIFGVLLIIARFFIKKGTWEKKSDEEDIRDAWRKLRGSR